MASGRDRLDHHPIYQRYFTCPSHAIYYPDRVFGYRVIALWTLGLGWYWWTGMLPAMCASVGETDLSYLVTWTDPQIAIYIHTDT